MKRLIWMVTFLFGALAPLLPAQAAGGTAEEAVALVKKAAAYIKANGRDAAFAEFNKPNGQFKDRDLYIMIYDLQGNNRAHGDNPRLVGKSLIDIKDANGVPIVKGFIEIAKGKGKGWQDYQWPNPVTKVIDSKSTYVERYEDLLIGSGIYR